jgi:hypothetical protein
MFEQALEEADDATDDEESDADGGFGFGFEDAEEE